MSKPVVIDDKAVRQLSDILIETGLTEIEYEANGCRIFVSRQIHSQTHTSVVSPTSGTLTPSIPSPTTVSSTDSWAQHPGIVRSPMVGTVYLAPEPGSPVFARVGENVVEGQILMIIEAMKVMNPIKSIRNGKILHVFVRNGKPVEYDEPLLVIE